MVSKSKVLFPHNVPITDKSGNPSPYFTRQLKILLDEKQDIATVADGAIQQGQALTELLAEMGGDPNANKILYWDDSTNTWKWLAIGTNLTIDNASNTLNATGGGGGSSHPWYWKPPTAADFSTMYASLRGGSVSNAITVADDTDAGMTFFDNSSDNGYIKAFGRPIPADYVGGNFTITAHIKANSISANDQFGIWARCSATKYVFFNLFVRGGNINVQRCYYNSAWSDGSFGANWQASDAWLRIVISNQTTSYYVSIDGKTWLLVYGPENLMTASYTDYGFCIGRFTLTKYTATCDHLTSDEYP